MPDWKFSDKRVSWSTVSAKDVELRHPAYLFLLESVGQTKRVRGIRRLVTIK